MDEERRSLKKKKEHIDMLFYVADAQYGIPSSFPCGGSIVDEVAATEAFDNFPGKRYFTCSQYKDDGLHFRQPWVVGVEKEIKKLTRSVEKGENPRSQVRDLTAEIMELKEVVGRLSIRAADLEQMVL